MHFKVGYKSCHNFWNTSVSSISLQTLWKDTCHLEFWKVFTSFYDQNLKHLHVLQPVVTRLVCLWTSSNRKTSVTVSIKTLIPKLRSSMLQSTLCFHSVKLWSSSGHSVSVTSTMLSWSVLTGPFQSIPYWSISS